MKLETTQDLIEAMRAHGSFASYNELAKATKIPQNTISSWLTGRTFPTEVHALKIGRFLGITPVLVLAIAAADRTRGRHGGRGSAESAEWIKVARQLTQAAA